MAWVNRDTDEVNLIKLRDDLRRQLQMDKRKSIRDNITIVSGNLAKYLQQRGLKNKLCPNGRWGKGPGKLVVQQMLLGLRPACYRDAVRQHL